MKNLFLAALLFSCMITAACAGPETAGSELTIVRADDVVWEHLNPARGDLAPKAGTLWGDRNGTVATGFLLRPSDGFESPPHIHNVSYRGIVIRGLIHNDDPDAADMWMPAGSFWTQPKGEVHITAAKGKDSLAYIEIEQGPYLVWPTSEAFDSGERPVNVDETNIVWVAAEDIAWIDRDGGPEVAFLWGGRKDGDLNGTLVKLPAGCSGTIHSHGSTFGAVVISGQLDQPQPLAPGSYMGLENAGSLPIASDTETVLYVRTDARYDIETDR